MYWITGVIGLVSILAPFVFGYNDNNTALWTNVIIGVALVAASAWEGFVAHDRDNLEYWLIGLVGIGAIAAPFVFGFSDLTEAFWTSVGAGVLAVLAAGTRLLTKQAL